MENLVRFLKFIRFILKNIKKLFKNILRFLKNYLGIIFEEISIYWKFANNFRKSIEDELDKIIEYKKKNIEHLQQQLIEETEETPISFSEPINVPNMFWISLLCLLYFVFSLRMTIWLIEFFYWLPFVHQKIRKYLLPFFYQKTHQYWLPFVHPNIREFIVEWYKSQNKKELRTNKTSNTSRPKRTKPVDISHPVNSFSDYKSSSQKRRSPYRSNNEASSDYDDAQTTNNNLIQPIQPVNNEISEKAGNLDPDINIINSNELLSERPSFNDEILNSNYDDTWINNNDLTQPIQIVDNETSEKSGNTDSDIDSNDLLPQRPIFNNEISNSDYDDAPITNNDLIQPIQPIDNEISKKSENRDTDIDSNGLLSPIDNNNPPPD